MSVGAFASPSAAWIQAAEGLIATVRTDCESSSASRDLFGALMETASVLQVGSPAWIDCVRSLAETARADCQVSGESEGLFGHHLVALDSEDQGIAPASPLSSLSRGTQPPQPGNGAPRHS